MKRLFALLMSSVAALTVTGVPVARGLSVSVWSPGISGTQSWSSTPFELEANSARAQSFSFTGSAAYGNCSLSFTVSSVNDCSDVWKQVCGLSISNIIFKSDQVNANTVQIHIKEQYDYAEGAQWNYGSFAHGSSGKANVATTYDIGSWHYMYEVGNGGGSMVPPGTNLVGTNLPPYGRRHGPVNLSVPFEISATYEYSPYFTNGQTALLKAQGADAAVLTVGYNDLAKTLVPLPTAASSGAVMLLMLAGYVRCKRRR